MAFNRKYTEKELNISNIHLHNLPERKFQNGKKWNFRKFQNSKKWNFRKFQNGKKWNFRNFQNGKKWNFRNFQIV